MQAIVTKYHGATNTRGSRIGAKAYGGSILVPYKYELDAYENHERAAHALMKKLGWSGRLIGGSLPDDKGYAFVFASGSTRGDRRRRR